MNKIIFFVKKLFWGLYDPLEANELLTDKKSNEVFQNEWELANSESERKTIVFDVDSEFIKLKERIQMESNQTSKKYFLNFNRKYLLKVAASILLPLFIASISYFIYDYVTSNSPENTITYSSSNGQRSFYTLVDGTKVWLNSNSVLKLKKNKFDKRNREVELIGEAFFDVTKSETPFIVIANNFEVKVYGTSFNVNAYTENESIEATLVRGKVSVNITDKYNTQSQILMPGQKASYIKSEHTLVVNEVNTEFYTAWVDGKLSFDNQYLDKVVEGLSKHFKIGIELAPELKQKYRYTLTIKDESITEVMELLKITSSINYIQKDGKIIISEK